MDSLSRLSAFGDLLASLLAVSNLSPAQGLTTCSILFLTRKNEIVGFVHLTGEVAAIREQCLEVDASVVVQKHTGDSWSILVSESCLDVSVDAISNEFISCLSLKGVEWGNINTA